MLVTGERLGPQRMLIERGDGPVPVLVALSPMRHAEGQDGALLYVRDLTEEERRARELEGYAYGRIISRSPNMQALFELVDHVAKSGATILLQGESGTGKELVAREIHRRSRRAAGPFHAVNCAAIAPDLLESEFLATSAGVHGRYRSKTRTVRGGSYGHHLPGRGGGTAHRAAGEVCGCSKNKASSASAVPNRWLWTSGSSPLRTEIWPAWWRQAAFGRICTTACASFR